METLLYELQTLDMYNFEYTEWLSSYKNSNKLLEAVVHKKINKLLRLFDLLLINDLGKCNWANIDILNENGYYVGPGERDSFGWLTGVVETKKGFIVYG